MIAGQPWTETGANEWGFRRYRTTMMLIIPSIFVYYSRGQQPSDYADQRRAWDFGVQWLGFGASFGLHWQGYYDGR